MTRQCPAVWLGCASLFLSSLSPSAACAGDIPNSIRICDIGGEWPPYAFYRREQGQPTTDVTGFSVDYIKDILGAAGSRADIELLPWRRCQASVAEGRHAMLLNASVNAQRQRDYLISKPYYAVHDVYFYATSRPKPKVETLRDLPPLRVCGQLGYNYASFGLGGEQVDTGTASFAGAMDKLIAGRCDLVLGRLEVAAGHRWTNGIDYTHSKDFGWDSIAGMAPASFHMMISRRLPYSNELLDLVNQGIDRMNASKRAKALEQRYLP